MSKDVCQDTDFEIALAEDIKTMGSRIALHGSQYILPSHIVRAIFQLQQTCNNVLRDQLERSARRSGFSDTINLETTTYRGFAIAKCPTCHGLYHASRNGITMKAVVLANLHERIDWYWSVTTTDKEPQT